MSENIKSDMDSPVTPPTLSAPTREAADIISERDILLKVPVSRRTLGDWRKHGKIPFIKIGSRVLYHWPSVEQSLLRRQN